MKERYDDTGIARKQSCCAGASLLIEGEAREVQVEREDPGTKGCPAYGTGRGIGVVNVGSRDGYGRSTRALKQT